jgi:tetratricopeptide (TPR) repeat protein
MDKFLDQMQSEGAEDSEGEFTISSVDALKKMREYQLARMGSFAAHFVASVVSAGGKYLRFDLTKAGLRFTLDAPIPTGPELEHIFIAPFRSGAPTWQKELAIGLNGCLGLKAPVVEIETWNNQTELGHSLAMRGADQIFNIRKSPWIRGMQGTKIDLLLRPPNARGFSLNPYYHAVNQELRERCALAPIELFIRGKQVDTSLPWSQSVIARAHWMSPSSSPGAILRVESGEHTFHQYPHDESYSAVISLNKSTQPDITIVVNGISYPMPEDYGLELPLAQAFVAYPELPKDLSQNNLQQNARTRKLHEWLNEKAADLLKERCRSFWPLEGLDLKDFNQSIKVFYAPSKTRPRPIKDWIAQSALLERARDVENFEEVREKTLKLDDARQRHIWPRLAGGQRMLVLQAYEWRAGGAFQEASLRWRELPVEIDSSEREALLTMSHVLQVEGSQRTEALPGDGSEVAWSAARRSICWLLDGDRQKALEYLEKATGAWKFYLKAHLELPDLDRAYQHLEQALRSEPTWSALLNELSEIRLLQQKQQESLALRANFLNTAPAGSVHWSQVLAEQARAFGSVPLWALWTAKTGISELTQAGRNAKKLHAQLKTYDTIRWLEVVQESETHALSSVWWRYLFHRAVWGLRAKGHWKQATNALYRRLLRASLAERDALSLRVPPKWVL